MNANNFIDSVSKSKNIRAFERLGRLAYKKGWNIRKLDDRGTVGLLKCIQVWFELNGFECSVASGNLINATNKNESVMVEIVPSGYHSISPSQKNLKDTVTENGGTYLICKNLSDFLEKFDDLFDI